MGVEPTSQPWEGRILPMKYTRIINTFIISNTIQEIKSFFKIFQHFIYKSFQKSTIYRIISHSISRKFSSEIQMVLHKKPALKLHQAAQVTMPWNERVHRRNK